MTISYFETGYRYIDNVRFFKENDPYFYKVDNIPLKQLDENVNFLKDQTDGLLTTIRSQTLGRANFSELQPYVDGFDSVVKVRPGRYTARVNDAYTLDPLQIIAKVIGDSTFLDGQEDAWNVGTANRASISAMLDKWHTKLAANATNMNGLYERSFVHPVQNLDTPGDFTNTSDPNTYKTGSPLQNTSPYPGFVGAIIANNTNTTGRGLRIISSFLNQLFKNTGRLESEFIKRWRGVSRTAVVDVPEELSLEIPAFDPADFYYIDGSGEKQTVAAAQRIDLLFVYSKPVDQSETTLASFTNGSPRTINAPVLGIVKGAGVGVSQKTATTTANISDAVDLQSLDGVTLMIPNPSDELAENTGFTLSSTTVRGSFPSPDDLMNLAPLLSEKLESTATPLIGQSILPLAYIVVKQSAPTTNNGTVVISPNDVIDIRPLLRTTELAYNERAGIAAAFPQISIANPVASEAYVDHISKDIVKDYNSKVQSVQTTVEQTGRVVAAGSVKGGMYYGVEGALAAYAKAELGQTTYAQAKNTVESRYGYPAGSIPDLPDWDIASWVNRFVVTEKGLYPNDRVNYHQFGMNVLPSNSLKYGCFSQQPLTNNGVANLDSPRVGFLGTDKIYPGVATANINSTQGVNVQYYVSKTINIDKASVPWMKDYYVSVQLWNCVPLSCRSSQGVAGFATMTSPASTSNIWVDKRTDSFTIYVSWVANDPLEIVTQQVHNLYNVLNTPISNRNDAGKYAGFSVINQDIVEEPYANSNSEDGSSSAGVALYPTVTFQVIGVPQSISNASVNINNASPTISLG